MARAPLSVEVRLPDEPATPGVGALTFLDNAVVGATGTVKLRATLPNADGRFWPGRFVKVRLVLDTIPGAVLIPAAAPMTSAEGSIVYVVKADDTAEMRPVVLGQRHGELQTVAKGVVAGERVVVVGQIGVTPGGKVAVVEPRARPRGAGRARRRSRQVNLSEPFIRRPVMTVGADGLGRPVRRPGFLKLPVNDLPAVDYPVIQVQASYPGASPETIANNIATPLERQFMQINGLELVTSKSTQGQASLTLQFALDKSIDAAATDVQTAISQATPQPARSTCRRRRRSPRPTRTTSRSCTSR